MIFVRIICEGQGYRSRRQVMEQRFSTMTWKLQLVVAEWGRGVRDVAMGSGSTGLPQTELSFLSPLDMATSNWKLTNVNLPYGPGMSYVRSFLLFQVASYPFSLWKEADDTSSMSRKTSLNMFTQTIMIALVYIRFYISGNPFWVIRYAFIPLL